MKIIYDPVKRAVTLAERGIDFEELRRSSQATRWIIPMIAGIMVNCACLRSVTFAVVW
jgi:hypothetical protein